MHTKPAETDQRIREHFDGQMELYAACHGQMYNSICAERIRLLSGLVEFDEADMPRLLDIGCGAGYFSDAFLERYPYSQAVAIDVSSGMVMRNQPDSRKLLLVADARAVPFGCEEFDLINFDTVLHHILHLDGYSSTIRSIASLLTSLKHQLVPGGSIMIREIYHEFFLWRSLGCRILYLLTTTRLPKPVTKVLRWAGINTANVGVCFLTREQWKQVFQEAGLTVVSAIGHRRPSPLRFLGLSSGEIYYYLKPIGRCVR